MLEVADRLIASIGQDTMDTFFWSLTHPSAFRLIFHFLFAVLYMFAHSFIMLLQGKFIWTAIRVQRTDGDGIFSYHPQCCLQ